MDMVITENNGLLSHPISYYQRSDGPPEKVLEDLKKARLLEFEVTWQFIDMSIGKVRNGKNYLWVHSLKDALELVNFWNRSDTQWKYFLTPQPVMRATK